MLTQGQETIIKQLIHFHGNRVGRLYRGTCSYSSDCHLFFSSLIFIGLVPPLLLEAPKRAVKLHVVLFYIVLGKSFHYSLVLPMTFGVKPLLTRRERPR